MKINQAKFQLFQFAFVPTLHFFGHHLPFHSLFPLPRCLSIGEINRFALTASTSGAEMGREGVWVAHLVEHAVQMAVVTT